MFDILLILSLNWLYVLSLTKQNTGQTEQIYVAASACNSNSIYNVFTWFTLGNCAAVFLAGHMLSDMTQSKYPTSQYFKVAICPATYSKFRITSRQQSKRSALLLRSLTQPSLGKEVYKNVVRAFSLCRLIYHSTVQFQTIISLSAPI